MAEKKLKMSIRKARKVRKASNIGAQVKHVRPVYDPDIGYKLDRAHR